MLDEQQDAYGRAMLDHLAGRGGEVIVERDDGSCIRALVPRSTSPRIHARRSTSAAVCGG
jgi:hypothetical protein